MYGDKIVPDLTVRYWIDKFASGIMTCMIRKEFKDHIRYVRLLSSWFHWDIFRIHRIHRLWAIRLSLISSSEGFSKLPAIPKRRGLERNNEETNGGFENWASRSIAPA